MALRDADVTAKMAQSRVAHNQAWQSRRFIRPLHLVRLGLPWTFRPVGFIDEVQF